MSIEERSLRQPNALRAFFGKRVFVSGGAGVIGRELVPMLDKLGAVVYVGDLEPRPLEWPARIAYREGDLNNLSFSEIEAFSPEIYFHLAATFERSTESPSFFREGHHHNVALSHHLINVMSRDPALTRVVFASSYLIYDPSLYTCDQPPLAPTPLAEDAAIRPRNLCGSAKHHHELEIEFLSACPNANFSCVSARIFRSYGRGSRDVISRWVRALMAGEALDVYGTQACFDYIFAKDVARGLLVLAESCADGVVNLGTGRPRRVDEVLEILRHHFPRMQTRTQPTQVRYEAASADATRLREQTGWSPATSLEEGIAMVVAHERERLRKGRVASEPQSGPARFSKRKARDVLIMSVSKKIPLIRSMRRALDKFDSQARVHGADCDANALGLHFVDVFWKCPTLDRLNVETLIDHCRDNGIRFIVPTRDAELPVFANYRNRLAQAGIEVLVSSPSSVANCIDKLRFAQILEQAGLPAIPTSENLDRCGSFERLVVKDRFGSGSKNLHCDVAPDVARRLASEIATPIFQPYVEGREFSIDLYRDRKGRVHGTLCRTRDSVVGGESQITTLVSSPELCELCERVVAVLDFWGHATLQAIEVAPGEFRMLECNARFGGASTLSDQAGLESFYWFLLEANGCDLATRPFTRARTGLKLIRHAADHFVEEWVPAMIGRTG